MDEAETEPEAQEDRNPDLRWTGWALETLRELVEIDMRAKRNVSAQQVRAGSEPKEDFALMQARLSRSVRLSVAMAERIRADYLHRKTGRKQSGEAERRRQRREQAVRDVVAAAAQPGDPEDAERVRSAAREKLSEDEVLDAQLDSLSPEEFVREVCRRIGYPPDWIRTPWGSADAAGPEADAGPAGQGAERAGAGPGWAGPPEESCPPSRPAAPDSS